MCECFRPLFPELVLDTTEIARGGKSYTIDTVRQMNARYPGAQLYFPMGSDMLLWFRNWAAYRELLRRVVLVAHLRTARTRLRCGNTRPGLRPRAARCCLPKRPCFPCPPPRCARWRQRAGVGRPCARKRGGVHCAAPSLYARGRGGLTRPAAGHLKRTLRPGRCGRERGDLVLISVDEAKRLAKKNLSPKRYEHTCNVRKLAVKLARPTARTKRKQRWPRCCTISQRSCRGTDYCRYLQKML